MEFVEALNQHAHMQGFSSGNGHMFWSFTNSLIKTTLDSVVRCQVQLRGGHLGDIDYHNGKIYGSFMLDALPGHAWADWSGYKLMVFDEYDLRTLDVINLDICDYYKSITCTPEDTRGFQGIDGVTIAPDPVTGEDKIFIACALFTGEKYSNQIILQFDMTGKYETEYHIPTGNTVYGIQNLDYDADNKEFWFTTYGSSQPYQAKYVLYCVSGDFKEIRRTYKFSTPYGLDCLGKEGFYACYQFARNGRRGGVAYRCDEAWFETPKTDAELKELIYSDIEK
jgi:hypothetical protein